MDGAGEGGKLALQPRELKFGVRVSHSEPMLSEAPTVRRGFRAPPKLLALSSRPHRHSVSDDADGGMDDGLMFKSVSKGDAAPPLVFVPSAAPGTGAPIPASTAGSSPPAAPFPAPTRGIRPTAALHGSLTDRGGSPDDAKGRRRRHEGNAAEVRKAAMTANPRMGRGPLPKSAASRALAPLAATAQELRTKRGFLVEGCSMLCSDSSHASHALSHLTECVAVERSLREQLEAAHAARLVAFRQVIKIHLGSCTDSGHSLSSPLIKAPTRSVQDTLALARCAVVTNTLAATIQSYIRAKQSSQLSRALDLFRRACGGDDTRFIDYNATLSLRSRGSMQGSFTFSGAPAHEAASLTLNESLSSAGAEVLNVEEVAKLKQLYFDYFDCESVALASLNGSRLFESGFAPEGGPVKSPTASSFLMTTFGSSLVDDAHSSESYVTGPTHAALSDLI